MFQICPQRPSLNQDWPHWLPRNSQLPLLAEEEPVVRVLPLTTRGQHADSTGVRTCRVVFLVRHIPWCQRPRVPTHLKTGTPADTAPESPRATHGAVLVPDMASLLLKPCSKKAGLFQNLKCFDTIFFPHFLQYIGKHSNKVTTNSWSKLFLKFLFVNTLSGLQNVHISSAPHLAP